MVEQVLLQYCVTDVSNACMENKLFWNTSLFFSESKLISFEESWCVWLTRVLSSPSVIIWKQIF